MVRNMWVTSLVLSALFLPLISSVTRAAAQEEDLLPESACRSCHENRYWLYDNGKWYCLCGKQGLCIDCHGGNDTVWDLDLAHEGIVVNPIIDNPSVCQKCHPEDADVRIERFTAVAGIDPHAEPQATSTPYAVGSLPSGGAPSWGIVDVRPEPWRAAGLSFTGLLFVGTLVFGFRCWRADCLSRTHGS